MAGLSRSLEVVMESCIRVHVASSEASDMRQGCSTYDTDASFRGEVTVLSPVYLGTYFVFFLSLIIASIYRFSDLLI